MRQPDVVMRMPGIPAQSVAANGLLSDRLGRSLQDLRISVTDRCNFRCNYCMPKKVFDKHYGLGLIERWR